MVGRNNQGQKFELAALRKHQFAIRKLTIGAASVLLGTMFWLESPVSTVHAETAGQEDKVALEDNSQEQKEDSSSDQTSKEENQQNWLEKANSTDQTDQASTKSNEKNPSTQDDEQSNDDSKQEIVFKPQKESNLGKEAGKFLLDEKFRSGDSAAEQKQEVKRADDSTYSQFKNGDAKWGSVNIADWDYDNHAARGSITLTGYCGLDKAHIVIPNDQDFMAAGHLFAPGEGVLISADTMNALIRQNQPVSLAISQTGNGTVKAVGGDWRNAFGGDPNDNEAEVGIKYSDPNLKRMDLTNLDTSHITNMKKMFYNGGSNLTTVGDLSAWNTSNVTDMQSMFAMDWSLKNIGRLDKWDTSKVTTMNGMFEQAAAITDLGNLNNWDTHNVTDMESMFSTARQLTNIGELNNWDTSKVTRMDGMFSGTSKLQSIGDIGNWDVSHVLNFYTMFSGAGLKTLGHIGHWRLNTSDLSMAPQHSIWMDHMFSGSKIEKLDLSGWDTRNVGQMAGIFADCRYLKEINISGWNFNGIKDQVSGDGDSNNVVRFAAGNKDQVIIANNLIGLDTEADRARLGLKATDFSSDHSELVWENYSPEWKFVSDGHDVVITNNPILLAFERGKEIGQKSGANSRYGFNGLKFYNDKITEGTPESKDGIIVPTILNIPPAYRNAWSQLWLTNPTWDNIDSYDGNYYFYLPAFYQSNGESDPLKVIKIFIQEAVQKEATYLKNNAASPFKGKDIGVHLAGLYFNGQEISLWPGEDGFLTNPNNPSEHLSDAEAQRRQDALLAQLAAEDPDALAVALVNAKYVVRVNNNVTPPSNPTEPTSPTSPSNPTNVQPSQPTMPTNPTNVQPTQPIIPPHSQKTPPKKPAKSTHTVVKHKVNRPTIVKPHIGKAPAPQPVTLHGGERKVGPVAIKATRQGHARKKLPKTGRHTEHLAELGLIALAFAVLLTLVEPRSKKKRE